jgi:hypothetical protein
MVKIDTYLPSTPVLLLDLWSTRERTNAAKSWPTMAERSSMLSHDMSMVRSSMKTECIPALKQAFGLSTLASLMMSLVWYSWS